MEFSALVIPLLALIAALAALLAWRSAAGLRQQLTRILDAQTRIEQGLRAEFSDANRALREELAASQQALRQALTSEAAAGRSESADALARFAAGVHDRLQGVIETTDRRGAEVRQTVEQRLQSLQTENAAKLDEMRRIVDEKLHATLRERLGESFRQVSDRLEAVHKGLGEMQALAAGVGDLKRVLTNVKTRGTWGEVQLARLLEDVMTPDQYARNVKPVPGSDAMVEFAIRLPGRGTDEPVWLPIDSKYPVEHYQRLLDAQDAADKEGIAKAGNALESSIKQEARKIAAKYIAPPKTTDFAVLYLPTESLFAEVLRRPGLAEAVQNDCRVVIAGPTNLSALLNSLHIGFKTLAVEKSVSQAWTILKQTKTEFGKFGDVIAATHKNIIAAANRFDEIGRRTRAVDRTLKAVEEKSVVPDDALALELAAIEKEGDVLAGGGDDAVPALK